MRPGPGLYIVVIVVLAAYFGWILDRMAAFTTHGFVRLDKLLIGFGLVLLALAIAGGLELLSRWHRRPHDHGRT